MKKHSFLLLLLLPSCHLVLSVKEEVDKQLCGNGILDRGEECDRNTFGGRTCQYMGFDNGVLFCSLECTISTLGCRVDSCGNNTIDGEENCDGTDLGFATCSDLGYVGGTLNCHSSCRFDTSQCISETSTCGNGFRESQEECDGDDLNNTTCATLGYPEGAVYCNEDCTFNLTNCLPSSRAKTERSATGPIWEKPPAPPWDTTGENSPAPPIVLSISPVAKRVACVGTVFTMGPRAATRPIWEKPPAPP